MSINFDPIEGLCLLCATISIPYSKTGNTGLDVEAYWQEHTDQPSYITAYEPRLDSWHKARLDSWPGLPWQFDHGPVKYVLRSARWGCSFCSLVALALRLGDLPVFKQETYWLSLKVECGYLIPLLVDEKGRYNNTRRLLRISPWTPASDVRKWVNYDPKPFRSVLGRDDTAEEQEHGNLKPNTIFDACLRRCIDRHDCGSKDETLLPTRVIDVGDEESGTVRLCEPGPGTHGKYAALTYCWGQSNSFVTTSANLEFLKSGFPIGMLPRTIRDAVELSRGLGLRYLWVDALCIIQGDDDVSRADWALQVGRMESVYANSLVTISAAGAPNSNCGLYSQGKCLLRRSGGGYLSIASNSSGRFSNEPINRRAWTLQEHLIASRLVICTSYGLVWQCNEALIGENTDNIIGFSPTYRYRLPNPPDVMQWARVVENFSARDLSKPADKFHAIAALARRYHAVTNDNYVAGLWESQLREHLLWVQDSQCFDLPQSFAGVARSKQYRAPTWSWASMNAPVRYTHNIRAGDHRATDGWLAEARCRVELADAGDPFGAVKAGWLTLRGPLVKTRLRWSAVDHLRSKFGSKLYLENLEGVRLGDLWLDDEPQARRDLVDGSTVWCLALYARSECETMVMLQGEGDPVEYTRIGLTRSYAKAEFREAIRRAPTETVVVV